MHLVIDLIDYRKYNAVVLVTQLYTIVNEHHAFYDKWLFEGIHGVIQPDLDGFNRLQKIAAEHIQPGDLVIIVYENNDVASDVFDQFLFDALEEWGRITVYTEPTYIEA